MDEIKKKNKKKTLFQLIMYCAYGSNDLTTPCSILLIILHLFL